MGDGEGDGVGDAVAVAEALAVGDEDGDGDEDALWPSPVNASCQTATPMPAATTTQAATMAGIIQLGRLSRPAGGPAAESPPSAVPVASRSRAGEREAPHDPQNAASSGAGLPHLGQNISHPPPRALVHAIELGA